MRIFIANIRGSHREDNKNENWIHGGIDESYNGNSPSEILFILQQTKKFWNIIILNEMNKQNITCLLRLADWLRRARVHHERERTWNNKIIAEARVIHNVERCIKIAFDLNISRVFYSFTFSGVVHNLAFMVGGILSRNMNVCSVNSALFFFVSLVETTRGLHVYEA